MSQSSTSWNGDIGTRYERLAAEYAKLRAQAAVLKKGVLEERAKNEKLTEDLKSAESVTRKLRSENESLSFRNEQLLKRVRCVQEELEESERSREGKKKEKKKGGESEREKRLETSLAILEEELKNKLIQNEKLTNKMEEVSQLNEMMTLQLKELKERMEEMNKEEEGLQSTIHPTNTLDYGISSSRCPSPLLHSPPSLSDSPLWQIAESGRAILSGLSTLFSLLQQRVTIFPYDASLEKLPPHVEQLRFHLGEASKKFAAADEEANRLFEQPAQQWQESSSSILSSMEESMQYCWVNLPHLLTSLSQEESRCAWSNSTLETLNERWRECVCVLLSSLSSLPSSITASIEGSRDGLEGLSLTAAAIHIAIKNTQESFSARWLIETRLPVQTKKGKCVGTATRDSLLKMLGISQKVTARLNLMVKEMAEREEEKEGDINKMAVEEKKNEEMMRNGSALSSPQAIETRTEPSSIVRKESVRSNKSNKSISPKRDEKDQLVNARKQSELDHLRRRVADLEGERERMLVDIALMRRKIVNGSTPCDDCGVSEEVERHYNGRLREISESVIQTISRGDYYSRECENLVRSVRCMEGERRKLEDQIESITREKLALFDELRMTQYGYETKLKEMSDHFTSLHPDNQTRDKEKDKNQKNNLARRLTLFK